MLHCNYNVLTLSIRVDGRWNVGDVYQTNDTNWRHNQFNGLKIRSIDYVFGVRLHFDYTEWIEKKRKYVHGFSSTSSIL